MIRILKDPFHRHDFVTCHHHCRATARSWCYVRESCPAASSWPFSSPIPRGLQQWHSVVVQDDLCLTTPPSGTLLSANCPSPRLRDDIGLLVGWESLTRWHRVRKFGVWGEFMDFLNFEWKLCAASSYRSNWSRDRPCAHVITTASPLGSELRRVCRCM